MAISYSMLLTMFVYFGQL